MDIAIRVLGDLFRSSDSFLWDDGFGELSKNIEEISSDNRSSASRLTSDLKMIDDDAEDLDLAREMNAMGLPSSFKTNKDQVRKESSRAGKRATLEKSSVVHDTKTLICVERSEVSVSCKSENLNSSLEDASSCSMGKSEDMSIDLCSKCSTESSRFYVNDVEWGVFWDDFYARNFYYNFHTQESTWFPPPEMEHYDLVKEEASPDEILESAQEGSLKLQKGKINEESSVLEVDYDLNLNLPTSAEFKNLHEHVDQITLSSEDSLDSTDQVSRSTSASSEICFQEEGTSISQTTDAMFISECSNSHQSVLKGCKETRAKRIRSNRKRLPREIQGQSPTLEMEGISPHLAKYWCQRYFLFSKFDCGVKMDEEGWFSVTPEAIAKHHASRCGSSDLVIDAFSGVGGNTIHFANKAGHVLAIDLDPRKVEYARHNVGIYGVGDNVDFVTGDFFLLSSRLKADTIFLSPPWGGPDYIKVPTYDIHSMLKPHGGKFLLETAAKIAPKVTMFLPKNVDPNQLAELALLFDPPWELEVEKNYLNGRLKGVTAYFSHPSSGRSLENPEGEKIERETALSLSKKVNVTC